MSMALGQPSTGRFAQRKSQFVMRGGILLPPQHIHDLRFEATGVWILDLLAMSRVFGNISSGFLNKHEKYFAEIQIDCRRSQGGVESTDVDPGNSAAGNPRWAITLFALQGSLSPKSGSDPTPPQVQIKVPRWGYQPNSP